MDVSETSCFQFCTAINKTVINNPVGKSLFTFMYVLLEKFAGIVIDGAFLRLSICITKLPLEM